jgi:hypothetical protein
MTSPPPLRKKLVLELDIGVDLLSKVVIEEG